MENTLKNKAKFFAQYWGQEVLELPYLIYTGNPPEPSHEEWGSHCIDEFWMPKVLNSQFPIWLKNLSDISDEDAIEVGTLNGSITSNDLLVGHAMVHWLDKEGTNRDIPFEAVDYLRSKGYALPWIGLSVEQQIKYGWVKIKN